MNKVRILLASLLFLLASVAFAQRNVGLEGSPNFRSLEGLTNAKGKKIKAGMLYRSGSFANLNPQDSAKLAACALGTVIDFRSDFEIQRDPDFLPADWNVRYVNAPIGNIAGDQKEMMKFFQAVTGPEFKPEQLDQLMIETNRNFAVQIADFKPLFDQLKAKDSSPILFHCSAGKDRTGLASALILHILGFDEKTIMEDFLRSNEAVAKSDPNKLAAYGIPADRAKALMGVKQAYLEASWEGIVQKYGSIDSMLLTEFGITKKVKKQLQAKYLTK